MVFWNNFGQEIPSRESCTLDTFHLRIQLLMTQYTQCQTLKLARHSLKITFKKYNLPVGFLFYEVYISVMIFWLKRNPSMVLMRWKSCFYICFYDLIPPPNVAYLLYFHSSITFGGFPKVILKKANYANSSIKYTQGPVLRASCQECVIS